MLRRLYRRLHGDLVMPEQSAFKSDLLHVTPIKCEKCANDAALIQVAPNAFAPGQFDTWTYQCEMCGHKMIHFVES